MQSVTDVDLPALEACLRSWGEPHEQARAYARRIWHWLYRDCATDIDTMEDLPFLLRRRFAEEFALTTPELVATEISPDGTTRKDLLRLADGAQIETVLLRYRDRYTVCTSTQVGCACGCSFCATGQMGFVRQLSAGEMVAQILHFQRSLASSPANVSNVVFMGMGEPLLNEKATLQAVDRLVDPRGLSFAPGRITLSTVGIVPGILRLAEVHRHRPIKLAISLHAATNDLRGSLVPVNNTYPLEQLFSAVRSYTDTTKRRVFFEWIMIDGVNDTTEQAKALVDWLQDVPAHINLIQLNPTSSSQYAPASAQAVEVFTAILDEHKIPHTMRQRRGAAIDAGCGQLCALQISAGQHR